jgi:class 3 adenylate cyclase
MLHLESDPNKSSIGVKARNMILIKRLHLLLFLLAFTSSGIFSQEFLSPDLKQVVLGYDSIVFLPGDYYGDSLSLIVNNKENSIYFELLIPIRESDDIIEKVYYSFFLDGYDSQWSSWTEYPVKEYTNLRSGEYILNVRSGTNGLVLSDESLFSFRVLRPLYFSSLFIIIYFAIAGLVVIILYKRFIHRHVREQELLERIIASRTEELMAEKEKTESLLANVLPKGAANELMEKGKVAKKKFNFATVLFSDIQGFTKIAEEVNPEMLIDELDKFFFQFDTVVGKYNIEKIKTIGDAYMCAGGIPKRNRTNPIEVILAALEMQQYMLDMKEEQSKKGLVFWDIRIGIHTGTVIAGVVGHKKLSYDIWGDTVNTASRMESSGEPGKINISGTTYDYVRDFFICEYRGKMPVKYKGELDMYFVNGIRPEMRLGMKNEPNDQFKNRLLMTKLIDLEEEVSEMYQEMLSEKLKFHDERYLKNIFTQAELIGRAERLSDEDMITLLLASAFIMTGFVENYSDPYPSSLELLKKIAPDYGFSDDHINRATDAINDSLTNDSQTIIGKIIGDSVYDYFGRVDLETRLTLLFEEVMAFNDKTDKKRWYTEQLETIRKHSFKTPTAQLLRAVSVERQVALIENYLEQFR